MPQAIPKEWIRRRIIHTNPALAPFADSDVAKLDFDLHVSYSPNRWVNVEFIKSLKDKLLKGFSVNEQRAGKEGERKLELRADGLRIFLSDRSGEASGARMLVLEDAITIKRGRSSGLVVKPKSVSLDEIWDEVGCDIAVLTEQYKDLSQKADLLRRKKREAGSELRKKTEDKAAKERNRLHGMIRKDFSPLQMMMSLLREKSEQGSFGFEAQVVTLLDTNETNLTIESESKLASQLFEGNQVEIRQCNRYKRAKIEKIENKNNSNTVILFDISNDGFVPDLNIKIDFTPRFGMKQQAEAVTKLMRSEVEGHWPNLANLLCTPKDLSPPKPLQSPLRFYCDHDPNSHPLNPNQRRAVEGAVQTDHAFFIQGPPGTGKTTVICELVQQLLERQEKVLLVAPTHVAVDEVLSRIGSKDGVRPLRLSWDESRIREENIKFTPSQIIDPFIEKLNQKDWASPTKWNSEKAEIETSVLILSGLPDLFRKRDEEQRSLSAAKNADHHAKNRLDSTGAKLKEEIQTAQSKSQAAIVTIEQLERELLKASDAFNLASNSSTLSQKLKSIFGLGTGPLKELRTNFKRVKKETRTHKKLENKNRNFITTTQSKLTEIETTAATALAAREEIEKALHATNEELKQRESSWNASSLFSSKFHPLNVGPVKQELESRSNRLSQYEKMHSRFDELVVVEAKDGDQEQLRKDILQLSNLYCCTTTGVAGSPEIRDVDYFDTLILDEASRVTDSEFLIAATKAKRWILVGDEKQLPPFVDQNDEYFVHALSALSQSDTESKPLQDTVDEMAVLWKEDEELHQFRTKSVLDIAQKMKDSETWEQVYREQYQRQLKYLNSANPQRALLASVQHNLVHSLFERAVESCNAKLKVPLTLQRRMIEPLADIVKNPVYGGGYESPSVEELFKSGVKPLTTSTFSKPITFLDTSAYREKSRDKLINNSFVNPFEADWVVLACRILDDELTQQNSGPVSVSILTFYKAQAKLIRNLKSAHKFNRLNFKVIDSIDGIQGQESDVVFLSFVRTSNRRNVTPQFCQWLQDVRRLNVACTRAHRAIIFVGQKELLGKLCSNDESIAFYKNLNDIFESNPQDAEVIKQFRMEENS